MKKARKKRASKSRKRPPKHEIAEYFETYNAGRILDYVYRSNGATYGEIKERFGKTNVKKKKRGKGHHGLTLNRIMNFLQKGEFVVLSKDKKYRTTAQGREIVSVVDSYFEGVEGVYRQARFSTSAKRSALEGYCGFLEQNLGLKPRECNVLCLTGPDMHERFVYNKLGIPPKNIVGVESDDRTVEMLQKKMDKGKIVLGELFHGDVKDFLEETDKQFHIVHLDYVGFFQPDYMEAIETMFSREVLAYGGVFAMTTLRGREQRKKGRGKDARSLKRNLASEVFSRRILFPVNGDQQDHSSQIEKFSDLISDEKIIPREELPYALGMIDYRLKQETLVRKFGSIASGLQKEPDTVLETMNLAQIPQDVKVIYYLSKSPMQVFMYKFEQACFPSVVDCMKWPNRFVSTGLNQVRIDESSGSLVPISKSKLTKEQKAEIIEHVERREDEGISSRQIRKELMEKYDISYEQARMYEVRPWRKGQK